MFKLFLLDHLRSLLLWMNCNNIFAMFAIIDEFNDQQKKTINKRETQFVIKKKLEDLTNLKVNSMAKITKKPYAILESPFIFYSKYATFILLNFLRKGFPFSKIPMSGLTLCGIGFYLFF